MGWMKSRWLVSVMEEELRVSEWEGGGVRVSEWDDGGVGEDGELRVSEWNGRGVEGK